jgi:hypothetical protein
MRAAEVDAKGDWNRREGDIAGRGHGRSFGGFRDFIEAAGLITTGPSSGDRLIGTDVSSIRA